MAKIISDIKDNWKQYDYSTQRYLDALASSFIVQHPCAAVSSPQTDGSYCISYNRNSTPVTRKKVSDIVEAINNGNYDNLLGLYLYFNTDFKLALKSHGLQMKDDTTIKDSIL